MLRFGGLEVSPPLLLAPMAGITHTAFRRMLGEIGSVGLYSTEMLSARSLPTEDPQTSPFLLRTHYEAPLSCQVLVALPEEIAPAFDALHALGADAIDLNLGCPAPEVRKRGGGSRLMEVPGTARGIVREARTRTALPLSAKIRLGETLDADALRDFCQMLVDEGVDLLTVHARLRRDPYGRKPRWDWIGRVKSWVPVPVVGNGGIFSAADARKCLAVSGCDGLMLGRGAVVRPWLFAKLDAELFGAPGRPSGCGRPALYKRFLALAEESFPPERQLGRIKQFTQYFSETYPFGHTLASAIQASRTVAEVRERSCAFFATNELEGDVPAARSAALP